MKLLTTDHKLYGYSGKPLDVLGKCTLPCSYKVTKLNLEFYVKTTAPPVLSLRACTDLWLIKLVMSVTDTKDNFLQKFLDVFDALGLLPGEHSLKVDPTVAPVVHPPERVPYTLKYLVKKELNRMKRQVLLQRSHNPLKG